MKTKTVDRCDVEFYATSPRLAGAYRRAVKRNKGLARWGKIRELPHVATHRPKTQRDQGCEMVMLSHADDDHLILTDSRFEPVVAGAFHLLFTEPTTHPGQVAQWMRTTNIRSENRLHVVKVNDLEDPRMSQLLGRVCLALGRDGRGASIIDAYLAGNSLLVRGPKHRMPNVATTGFSGNGKTRLAEEGVRREHIASIGVGAIYRSARVQVGNPPHHKVNFTPTQRVA